MIAVRRSGTKTRGAAEGEEKRQQGARGKSKVGTRGDRRRHRAISAASRAVGNENGRFFNTSSAAVRGLISSERNLSLHGTQRVTTRSATARAWNTGRGDSRILTNLRGGLREESRGRDVPQRVL